jgi:hypothetical protein
MGCALAVARIARVPTGMVSDGRSGRSSGKRGLDLRDMLRQSCYYVPII